jgi:hypothetical protein
LNGSKGGSRVDGLNWARLLEKHSQNARTRVGRCRMKNLLLAFSRPTGVVQAQNLP